MASRKPSLVKDVIASANTTLEEKTLNEGSNVQNPRPSEPETEEAKAFASSVLSDPSADIRKISKNAKKRKAEGVERSKAISKKTKAHIEDEEVEGEEEEAVAEPGIKDSQILGGSVGRRLGVSSSKVGWFSVGVTPKLNLFNEMFNVLHQGDLSYFQIRLGVVNMLYPEKPGKVNPNRWHRYWFVSKDAFPDEVPSQFSVDYTALNPEASEETMVQLNKLVEGFPKPFPLKTFCDPDKFKGISLAQLMGSKKAAVPKKSKAKEPIPKVIPPTLGTPGLTSQEVESSSFRDPPSDEPHILHAVTDNSTSRVTSSLAADMFKNCMLRPEVLGTMGVHSPTRLHDQFSHYQLSATEAGNVMFLKLQKATADTEELSVKSLPLGIY
ncbi:hypothetical protein LIER_11660 [Lithospermum erythrorhizon]|uniref:Uncharacterized protein n=1 Tax=Lithospermum erythrorhizon TaxID=34254 RepID=A0AAV3PQV5_LITER